MQDYILVNEDDQDLDTIKIPLPEPPKSTLIDNHGKKKENQFFAPPDLPHKLAELGKNLGLKEINQYLNDNRIEYADEIEFIDREWSRRLNGYWFYNNGDPTYITGPHYLYISWWRIDVGLPKYRSRDRKFFLLSDFCQVDTTLPDGTDLGRRVCYGFNYPKHRREGATYKAGLINYEAISRMELSHGGIQSMDGTSAEKAFQKAIVSPWRRLPFFFKPMWDGSTNPRKKLLFDAPSKRGGTDGMGEIGLESMIDFAETANRDWFDGDKLHVYHNDELGKTRLENVDERHIVVKKCLSQGNGTIIHGLSINTSTVGEMEEKGGRNFFNLCKKSHYGNRDDTGQTTSGLYNLFIPAYDGLEGFIDRYGNSIIEDPDKEALKGWDFPIKDRKGKPMGAKRFLQSKRDDLLLSKDESSIRAYEEELRLHPMSFSECFITAGAGSGLNLKKITQRIKELQFKDDATQVGNFMWENGIEDSKVVWVPSKEGRFRISYFPPAHFTNALYKKMMTDSDGIAKEVWFPSYPEKFTASADPFKFLKTETKRQSDGGGNVFWERDLMIDAGDKPIDLWETYRNVCTYRFRPPTPTEYAEDMLMMSVYYGAMIYPEIDVPLIWEHFIKRGYDGFLKYGQDPNGVWRKTPGFNSRENTKQAIFQKHKQYIELHCSREMHIEILEECKAIKGVEDMTNYDLFTAVGGCYLGSDSDYGKFVVHHEEAGFDVQDYFPSNKY